MYVEFPASKKSISLRKPVQGIGINDVNYHVLHLENGITKRCPFYFRWNDMLVRCYSKKYILKKASYQGCFVCDDWLLFSNFREWMKSQDWIGLHLDKDLINPGNKEYSPENCLFVSPELNSLLTDSAGTRGKYPKGVSFNKPSGKYMACCSLNGKNKTIGRFETIGDAKEAYNEVKANHIRKIAQEQNDERLKHGLILHAERIECG